MHFRTITWREKNIATNKAPKDITQGQQGHQGHQGHQYCHSPESHQ